MSDFKYYIEKASPKYKYRVKLAVDDVTECMLDKLERCLEKYELAYASPFKKTPIQESPLDFPNVKNMAVFMSDIETSYPSTDKYLQQKISSALGINEQFVVVYTEFDPRKYETDLFLARQEDQSYEPRLGKDDYEGEECESTDYKEHKSTLLSELETELSKGGAKAEADDVLPADYHDYDKQKEENSAGLFGRMKPKVNYGR